MDERGRVVKSAIHSPKSAIAYYVSSHGYGHGVRSCDIVRAINALHPRVRIDIVSDLPRSFFASRLNSAQNSIRPGSFDVGMVQIDSIRVDVDATLAKIERLYSQRKELVAQEAAFLKENGINLVIADIPALPIEAASTIGIPCVAIGNFAWDWIYSAYVARSRRWEPVVNVIREEYSKTDMLLRLPFCDEMKAFPHIEDIPLVASPGEDRRPEIADYTKCDPAKKWILLSFTTLDWNDDALTGVECLEKYEFFTVRPLEWRRRNIHPLNREQVSFADVVASVDAVISKPGYGILSDCVVNQKPLIYADRADFMEYRILENAIRKYLRHIHIPAENLYRGDLRESLERIWDQPVPAMTLEHGGDRIAAERIMQFLDEAEGSRQ